MSLGLHMQNHKEPLENEKFKWCLRRMQMPSNRQFFSDARYLTLSWLGIVQRYWRMLITHELDWKRDCFYSGKWEEIGIHLHFCRHKNTVFFSGCIPFKYLPDKRGVPSFVVFPIETQRVHINSLWLYSSQ